MRKVWLVCSFVLMMGLGACGGAQSGEVRTAKTAVYRGPGQQLFDIALQVTQESYKIHDADPAKGSFLTSPQFYNREGGRQSAGQDGYVNTSHHSVILQMLVQVVSIQGEGEGERFAITVTPKTYQVLDGSPKPRELLPDDPYMPGWVPGRADALAVAIYERAQKFAVPTEPVMGQPSE